MSTQAQSIIRMLLSLLGAWLIGKNLKGVSIDPALWQIITGVIISLISLIWGIATKSVTEEMVESGGRQILIDAGGIFVTAGLLSSSTLMTVIAAFPIIVSFIWSLTTRSKTARLQSGAIQVSQLKK